MSRSGNRRGFTLVELVIVIAILAILAAIAIPSVMNIMEKANNSADLSSARTFENSLNLYVAGVANSGGVPTFASDAPGLVKIENAIVTAMATDASFTAKSEGWKFYVNTETLRVSAASSSPGAGYFELPAGDVTVASAALNLP